MIFPFSPKILTFPFGFLMLSESGLVITEACVGIPITDKWLLKFGFDEIKNDLEPDEYVLRKSGSIERLFTLKKWKESFFYIEQGNVIKYVHQFQNLFFALKGEELEINQ